MVASRLILCLLLAATFAPAQSFDLTPEQVARMEKFLPKSYPKLARRDPIHIATIGDSVLIKYGYDQDNGNALKAWSGIFVQELADQFLYSGGARLVKPPKGLPEKLIKFYGPEVTMENFSRGGRLIFHALQPLSGPAFENKPDIVIVSYGINDTFGGLPLSVYRRSIEEVVAIVRARGADLILCGPSAVLNDPPEASLAVTRPYVSTMREVAEANGVFFADLGDLAWLVRLDENPHPLEGRRPKAPAAATDTATPTPAPPAATTNVAPPPAPIISPVAGAANPDPDEKAMGSFQQVVSMMRTKFNHGDQIDWVHPDSGLHRTLGRRVFQELIDGPRVTPWKTGNAALNLDGANKAVLTYRMENTTDTEQTYTVLPLVAPMWKPLDAPSRVTLKPGKKALITVSYARGADGAGGNFSRSDVFPTHEPFLRIPVLTLGGGLARIEDLRATILPIAVMWNAGTMFNVLDAVELEARLVNTSPHEMAGTWEAQWMGQKVTGDFKVATRTETPLKVKLKMPDPTNAAQARGTLVLSVTSGGNVFRFEREIEVARNIGLKETVPMFDSTTFTRDKPFAPAVPGSMVPGVAFRADADSSALYLTFDIYGYNLQDNPNGTGALAMDVNIDARSYGKRLTPGSTDPIRVSAAVADGVARVAPFQVWAFGSGYTRVAGASQMSGKLTTRPDGARRLTFTLPRAFLYLHEWAMGNGNSQVGINTSLTLWQPGDGATAPGTYPLFVLTASGRPRDDAESLMTLELTDKPTTRWTVRFY